MKAIILAAGEGSRLRPYTLDRPKCLVEVAGVSLIDRQISILQSCGIDEVVVIGGYRSEMLEGKGTRLRTNDRYAETNMVWTLFCAEEELSGEVIVSYGDIVYSGKILEALLKCKSDIAVTIDTDWENYWRARSDDPLQDAESLKLTKEGSIYEIGRKPKSIDEIEGQYMGLMKFTAKGLEVLSSTFKDGCEKGSMLDKKPENAYMTDLLMEIVNQGGEIKSVPIRHPWIEIDTTEDLESEVTLERIKSIEE
jgi:choline kinase